ncbi:MAG: 2OG-Fe(II) oxygenase [Pseudomonadota bacterium]|nr:2OG-Fe(II) oxygenase [Pseudomonadota bacterium]
MDKLSHYVRVYDHDHGVEESLCGRMIESFAGLSRFQRPNGRGVRAGLEESAWTELNVTALSDVHFLGMFRQIIDQALVRYNNDIGLPIPIPNTPLTSELVMKRYRPGQEECFQLHFDAINFVSNRYLVLIWYLNDVAEGGETSFPYLDLLVKPRRGRLLMFPPYWMYQHQGLAPLSGDKYILSTYLLFDMARRDDAPAPNRAAG